MRSKVAAATHVFCLIKGCKEGGGSMAHDGARQLLDRRSVRQAELDELVARENEKNKKFNDPSGAILSVESARSDSSDSNHSTSVPPAEEIELLPGSKLNRARRPKKPS